MGQKVRVVLDRIDSLQKRLQFALIEEEMPAGRASRPTKGKAVQSKAKKPSGKRAADTTRPNAHPYKPPKASKLKPKKRGKRGKK